MSYDWIAGLVLLGALVLMSVGGKFLAFRIPALQQMRELNGAADHEKMSRKGFREAVRVNNRAGLITNVVFFVGILPWCVDLAPRALWRHLVDIGKPGQFAAAGVERERVGATEILVHRQPGRIDLDIERRHELHIRHTE